MDWIDWMDTQNNVIFLSVVFFNILYVCFYDFELWSISAETEHNFSSFFLVDLL